MKKTLAFWLSITLFTLGDWISKPMYYSDYFAWLYPAYNKLMCWSSDVQDRYKCAGPWLPVKPKKEQKRKKRTIKKLLKDTESQ